MALADRAELAVRLTLDDRGFTGPLRRVKSNLSGLDKATSNTQRALGRTGATLQRTALIAASAATGGFLAAVNAAGDFQDAFQGIVKTVDAPAARLEELRTQIRAMAREMPIAATELARIGETAGALGIDPSFIDEFIETVAKLSVTTNLTSDEAADSLGRISTILGFTGKDIQTFASALVALGNKGASTEAEIIEVTKRFAASGAQAGLSTDQILGFSSAISSLGVEPEAAGTALSKAFGRIIQETATASEEGKEFAKVAGVSFKEFSKIVENDTNKAMIIFLEGLGKLDKFGASRALEDLGITGQRERDAILKFAHNTGFLAEQLDVARVAIKDTSAINTEAAKRFDTFNSKLQVAKNILTDVGITIGDRLLPKLIPLFEEFGDFVANNGPAIDKFGDDVASAFTGVVDAFRNIPWDGLTAGLRLSGEIAKGVFNTFKSLPGPLQAALIGGFVANKATGGLLTGIGKDVGGAAINKLLTGSFLGRGSSPANPMWVAAAGGLGGAGGVGGTGKGGGLGILGALGAAGLVVGAGQLAANALGATSSNPVSGASRAFYRNETPGVGSMATKTRPIGLSPDDRGILNAISAKTSATIAKLEANRLTMAAGLNRSAAAAQFAGQQAAFAIRDKDMSPVINNTINVRVPVTVRAINQRTTIIRRLGNVAS